MAKQIWRSEISNRIGIEHQKRKKAVLDKLDKKYPNKSEFARALKTSRFTVWSWFRREEITPIGALIVSRYDAAFPKELLRPDVLDWDHYERILKQRTAKTV